MRTAVFLLAMLFTVACSDPPPARNTTIPVCAKLDWKTGPTSKAANRFNVLFWDCATGDERGPFEDPAGEVSVTLAMSCCGGKPDKPFVQGRAGRGEYEVKGLELSNDTWIIGVLVKNGASQGTKQFTVKVD